MQCRTLAKIPKQFIFQESIKVQMSCKMYSLVEITSHTERSFKETSKVMSHNNKSAKWSSSQADERRFSGRSIIMNKLTRKQPCCWSCARLCERFTHSWNATRVKTAHSLHRPWGWERKRESHLISEKDVCKVL